MKCHIQLPILKRFKNQHLSKWLTMSYVQEVCTTTLKRISILPGLWKNHPSLADNKLCLSKVVEKPMPFWRTAVAEHLECRRSAIRREGIHQTSVVIPAGESMHRIHNTIVVLSVLIDDQLEAGRTSEYLPVIKHGWLENGPFIGDFPNKTSIQFGNFPLPAMELMTPEGNPGNSKNQFSRLLEMTETLHSKVEMKCLSWKVDSIDWFKGKNTGKSHDLHGKSMVSCNFSLKPINWWMRKEHLPCRAFMSPLVFLLVLILVMSVGCPSFTATALRGHKRTLQFLRDSSWPQLPSATHWDDVKNQRLQSPGVSPY